MSLCACSHALAQEVDAGVELDSATPPGTAEGVDAGTTADAPQRPAQSDGTADASVADWPVAADGGPDAAFVPRVPPSWPPTPGGGAPEHWTFFLAADVAHAQVTEQVVATSGLLAELGAGLDVRLGYAGSAWSRLSVEASFGWAPQRTSALVGGGNVRAGGGHLGARALYGLDFTDRMFARVGGEAAVNFDGPEAALHVLADFGVRPCAWFEVALRFAIGAQRLDGLDAWSMGWALGLALRVPLWVGG